ncbi:hypothetical protein KSD_36600 [Ktedonobacter sp. SOSP1-85]|uniref:serine/threonine protein kinase n=1 Tax=Ktedonobacter sp. SOSP1-85 TaxID=2778367 RepID=UPI001915C82D|nr:serine/threonine-protein kinase [Ktedonobacter sp. SOSP1-85]GHO75889.1 hypothetical protein KSD_36600 [Ktedonobacter sp. SOSP1-85]
MVNVDRYELPFSFEQPEYIRVPLLNILQQAEKQGQTATGMSMRPQHVLIIDPNENRSRYIKHLLATSGYPSMVTTSALDAFTLILQGTILPFAVVLGHAETNDRFFLQRLLTQTKQQHVVIIRLLSQARDVTTNKPSLNWPETGMQRNTRPTTNPPSYTLPPLNYPDAPASTPTTPAPQAPISRPFSPFSTSWLEGNERKTQTPAERQVPPYQSPSTLPGPGREAPITQIPQRDFPSQSYPALPTNTDAALKTGNTGWPREQTPSPAKRAPELQLPSLEGQELGRYRVSIPLSKHVYRTYDRMRESDIALKAYPTDAIPYALMDRTLEEDNIFQLEFRLLESVKHAHILPVLNTGKSYISGVPFIFKTMPLCSEGPLNEWIRERKNKLFTPRDVAPVLMQLAEALQFAHENNVIYQNFKFSNLLIQKKGKTLSDLHLLLGDFAVTQDGSFFSHSQDAYLYVAPERWSGRVLPASDQYGLAAMMYELLTGRPPFQKAAEQTMKHMHLNMPPQPPSSYNAALSTSVNMVLLKALAKRPEERFASVLHFAEAFRNYCV